MKRHEAEEREEINCFKLGIGLKKEPREEKGLTFFNGKQIASEEEEWR